MLYGRTELIQELCRESGVAPPRGKTPYYMSRRALSDVLLSVKNKNSRIASMEEQSNGPDENENQTGGET